MKKIKGRNMLIFVDGKAIAGNVDCSIQMETETVEVCPTTQALWREYITKCSTWKCSSNHLLIFDSLDENGNVTNFMTLLGKTVTLMFSTIPDDPEERTPSTIEANKILALYGSAIVTSVSIDAKNGSHVSGSFEFQGTGAINYEQADYWVDGGSLYAKASKISFDETDNSADFVDETSEQVADNTLSL